MQTYHITRIVRHEYTIDAETEAEAIRKLNRAVAIRNVTVAQKVMLIPPCGAADAGPARAEVKQKFPKHE